METKMEECQELKNIKYKSMLLSGGINSDKTVTLINSNSIRIDNFLEKESKQNKNEPWNKLDKPARIKQLNDYADNINEYALNTEEIKFLKEYLITSLDKNKLQCVKDVQYDKTSGKIKNIPCLQFNPVTRKFTLKRNEKRASTTKSLGKGITKKKV